MKHLSVFASTLVIFLAVQSVVGQSSFYKHYSDNGSDFGQGICELEDSSFLLTGASSSFTANTQAFLIHIDTGGNYLWSRQYGGQESDWGVRVMSIPNEGHYVAGFTNSFGADGYDPYYFKTNPNGDLLWEKTLEMPGWQKISDAILLPDSGMVMVGQTTVENTDILVIKTDKNGELEWLNSYGGEQTDYATCVGLYHDSTILVGATMYIVDSLKYKAGIVSLNLNGQITHVDTIGSHGNYVLNDFILVGDTLQGVGARYFSNEQQKDQLGFSFDLTTHNMISVNQNPNNGSFEATMLTSYGDHSKRYIAYNIVASFTNPYGEDLHFGRFNENLGWIGQAVQVIFDYPDVGGQLIPTSDGGAAAIGYTSGYTPGNTAVFVLKIGPNELYPDMNNFGSEQIVGFSNTATEDPVFAISPNPSSDHFIIRSNTPKEMEVLVYDISGKIQTRFWMNQIHHLDMSRFESGMYYLHFLLEQNTQVIKKIIKT